MFFFGENEGAQKPKGRRNGGHTCGHISGSGVQVYQQSHEKESSGINSIPQLKHIVFEHKILDPEEKAAMASARYHTGAWERSKSEHNARVGLALDSAGIRAALGNGNPEAYTSTGSPGRRVQYTSELVEPVYDAKGGLVAPSPGHRRKGAGVDPYEGIGSKGRIVRPDVDHLRAMAGGLTADGVEAVPQHALPAHRARVVALQRGVETAAVLLGGGDARDAVGASNARADTRAVHYGQYLSGSGVGGVLHSHGVGPPQPPRVPSRGGGGGGGDGDAPSPAPHVTDVPPGTKVLAAHPPASPRQAVGQRSTTAAALAARSGTAVSSLTHPDTGPAMMGGGGHFTTVTAATFTGAVSGGPRAKTPPRRRFAAAQAGTNDPYRKTSIY